MRIHGRCWGAGNTFIGTMISEIFLSPFGKRGESTSGHAQHHIRLKQSSIRYVERQE